LAGSWRAFAMRAQINRTRYKRAQALRATLDS